MVKNGHWGKVKLSNFKKFFLQLFFIGYVFDPAYWLLPQKLFPMIFFDFFFGKIVIFEKNHQNRLKKRRHFTLFEYVCVASVGSLLKDISCSPVKKM